MNTLKEELMAHNINIASVRDIESDEMNYVRHTFKTRINRFYELYFGQFQPLMNITPDVKTDSIWIYGNRWDLVCAYTIVDAKPINPNVPYKLDNGQIHFPRRVLLELADKLGYNMNTDLSKTSSSTLWNYIKFHADAYKYLKVTRQHVIILKNHEGSIRDWSLKFDMFALIKSIKEEMA